MITLRPYQDSIIKETRLALRRFRSVLMQLPTGAGKTACAAWMANSAAGKEKQVLFICHRQELIDQTAQTFDKVGLSYSYIAAGYPHNPKVKIHIASIQTLANRIHDIKLPDLCIWDEAHHIGAKTWGKTKEHFFTAYHIGLTATPTRSDGKGLDPWFDHLIMGPTVSSLIEQGHLANYRIFAPSTPDLSGVHTRMGDYAKGELDEAMDRPSITGDLVTHYRKLADGRRAVVFACSINHSEHIVASFNEAGIPAAHLDGKTPRAERKAMLQAFARGQVKVISNVDLFGEGFDLSANSGMDVVIECVISARPTQSLGLWMQQCGRALRPQPEALILDHAGNAMRHGLPDTERDWTLAGSADQGRRKKDKQEAPVRQCPDCFYVHKPAPACPSCGTVYKVQGRKIDERDGELVELTKDQIYANMEAHKNTDKQLQYLITLGRRKGYKEPEKWAAHVWTARLAKQRQERKAG